MYRCRFFVVLFVLTFCGRAQAGFVCTPISGSVFFGDLQVEPGEPLVGDEVELRFDVRFQVYSVSTVELLGAGEVFEGDTLHFGSSSTFQLTATNAGVAELRLEVVYETEEGCVDAEGNMFFQPGPSMTTTSGPYVLEVFEPTQDPTPTATPQSTATPVGRDSDDDGCQVVGRDGAGAAWMLVLPLALLGVVLRREKRLSRPS